MRRTLKTAMILITVLIVSLIFLGVFAPCIKSTFIGLIGKEIFNTKEVMWVAITGIVTSLGILLALVTPIYMKHKEDEDNLSIIRSGLKQEVKSIYDVSFTDKDHIKCSTLFRSRLQRSLNCIKNVEKYGLLEALYQDRLDFEELVRTTNSSNDRQIRVKLVELRSSLLKIILDIQSNQGSITTLKGIIDKRDIAVESKPNQLEPLDEANAELKNLFYESKYESSINDLVDSLFDDSST